MVHDSKLRRELVRLLVDYNKASDCAPGDPIRAWLEGTEYPPQWVIDDAQDRESLARQRVAIDDGLDAIAKAMKRVNHLEFLPFRKG